MGIWPCTALAETRRHVLAGIGAAMATLMGCFALLSQSRGTALAMAASLVAVLALAPGRTRRAWGLLLVAGGVAAAGPSLLHVYDHHTAASIPAAVGHSAGRAALLASLGVGIAWGLATLGWELSALVLPAESDHRGRAAAALDRDAGAVGARASRHPAARSVRWWRRLGRGADAPQRAALPDAPLADGRCIGFLDGVARAGE